MNHMIEVKDVTKRFGKKTVLDEVSFSVAGGEFVSIIGPSGAGKTTLIHSLIGAEKIDEGSIKVDHYHVNKLSEPKKQEFRRKIGIIFQSFNLLDKKTVFENVAFALEVNGYPREYINKRTVEVLKVVGLEEERNQFPHQLSGGEKQRTAIARALAHAPQLLIADEPTGNLDPDNALALAELLVKINKNGTTIILSTHDRDIVNHIKSRVLTMKNGILYSDKEHSGYGK